MCLFGPVLALSQSGHFFYSQATARASKRQPLQLAQGS